MGPQPTQPDTIDEAFFPARILSLSKSLTAAEKAGQLIYSWIDDHTTARDVIPREMDTEAVMILRQFARAIAEAKQVVDDMNEFVNTAATKAMMRKPLSSRERQYMTYLGVIRDAPGDHPMRTKQFEQTG